MVKWLFAALLLLGGCLPTGRSPAGESSPLSKSDVKTPRLVRPPSPTTRKIIRLEGYATPGHRIELYVNSLLAGDSIARSDGRFEISTVRLQSGLNIITAVAIDSQGRRSESHLTGGGERAGFDKNLTPEVRVVLKP